jgi:hypothetical protein
MAIFEHIRLFNAGVWQAAQEDEPHGSIERSKQINSRVVLQSIMLASISFLADIGSTTMPKRSKGTHKQNLDPCSNYGSSE